MIVFMRQKIASVLLFILAFGGVNAQKSCYIVQKPTHAEDPYYSGDKQNGIVEKKLPRHIFVQVLDDTLAPVPNKEVHFTIISCPDKAKGQSLEASIVNTTKDGYASTYITLGTKPGDYYIQAKVEGECLDSECIFKVKARKRNWMFLLIIGLLGGLGLFLFGMKMMSRGMQKSAGDKMRAILSTLTRNRFIGVAVGAFITLLIQSSSATTVMLVGFVESGLMQFVQSLGVILGADIGTTITAQIIAFKLTDYALLFIALGFILQMVSKKERLMHIGEAILGFGILFFGMHIMSSAMYPLRSYEPFLNILLQLENPLLGILIGTLFTALIQSSSAFIGIMIVLASQGFLSLQAAIPLVLGSNIGTAITALLASLNTGREAKRVALGHTLFKVMGVLVFVFWLPGFEKIVIHISPKSDALVTSEMIAEILPRQIANAHTLFNISLTIIFIPFTKAFGKLIVWMLPEKEKPADHVAKLKFIDKSYIGTPVLALNMAKQEVLHIGDIVSTMLRDINPAFIQKDGDKIKAIEEREKEVDYLVEHLKNYLIQVTQSSTDSHRVNEAFQMIYTVKELEQIADIISTNMIKHAIKWQDSDYAFSEDGKNEIMVYHTLTMRQYIRCIEVFKDRNLEKAHKVKHKGKKYRAKANELELLHYERLRKKVPESIESSKVHIEILNTLKMIGRHLSNIARIIIEWSEEEVGKSEDKGKG